MSSLLDLAVFSKSGGTFDAYHCCKEVYFGEERDILPMRYNYKKMQAMAEAFVKEVINHFWRNDNHVNDLETKKYFW
jgi:hypothetical protein